MKKLMWVLALSAAIGSLGTPALAVGRLADVTVTDRSTGTTLPLHYYRGEYWVAGVPGAKYAIDVRNALGRRVLAVTSVDGVNVVSGETANTAQTGYVLGAYQRYGITGWRKSNNDVAAFEFTASPNSYAERTGRPRDVGVIGVALFRERAPVQVQPTYPPTYPQHHDRSGFERYKDSESSSASAAARPPTPAPLPAPSARAADAAKSESATGAPYEPSNDSMAKRSAPQSANIVQPAPKLGTGHGERETSVVTNTEFERESTSPAEVIRIRYDSYANLLAMGVIPTPRPVQPRPNPFPDGAVGYTPDPPQWR
jgi:hypothetical protein